MFISKGDNLKNFETLNLISQPLQHSFQHLCMQKEVLFESN